VKTDDLIDMLARGGEPASTAPKRMRVALALFAGFAVALLMVKLSLGMRADLGVALWAVLAKAGFSALATALALAFAMRLMRPGRPLGWRIAAVGVFVGAALLAGVIALLGKDPAERLQALTGGVMPWCLIYIPIFASPAAVALVWLARGFAPTRLTLTGAALGALSGGIGAMAYAMYCPIDSVAFVTTWYVLAIALCAAVGALVGSKLLRW
jgi:hypothetical protein